MLKNSVMRGVKNPIFWGWNITGNWFMQSMLREPGHPHHQRRQNSLGQWRRVASTQHHEGHLRGREMKNLSWKDALASFSAGEDRHDVLVSLPPCAVERAKGD
ncbi:MAG: hypothetical protein R3F37_15575 [Candidatus Competibacteraceae bacterium]